MEWYSSGRHAMPRPTSSINNKQIPGRNIIRTPSHQIQHPSKAGRSISWNGMNFSWDSSHREKGGCLHRSGVSGEKENACTDLELQRFITLAAQRGRSAGISAEKREMLAQIWSCKDGSSFIKEALSILTLRCYTLLLLLLLVLEYCYLSNITATTRQEQSWHEEQQLHQLHHRSFIIDELISRKNYQEKTRGGRDATSLARMLARQAASKQITLCLDLLSSLSPLLFSPLAAAS